MNRINIDNYYVEIETERLDKQLALLSPALRSDLPKKRKKNPIEGWDFDWDYLWLRTDFRAEDIIKLTYDRSLFGLVRYGLYTVPRQPNPEIYFLEIEQLEANPLSRGQQQLKRLIKPIGKWLIWYCVKVALKYGHQDNDKPLITLSSYPEAIDYYREVIGMELIGVTNSAPGEDLYGFRFQRQQAEEFIIKQELSYGLPRPTRN